jgi:hypothetical protein
LADARIAAEGGAAPALLFALADLGLAGGEVTVPLPPCAAVGREEAVFLPPCAAVGTEEDGLSDVSVLGPLLPRAASAGLAAGPPSAPEWVACVNFELAAGPLSALEWVVCADLGLVREGVPETVAGWVPLGVCVPDPTLS